MSAPEILALLTCGVITGAGWVLIGQMWLQGRNKGFELGEPIDAPVTLDSDYGGMI